MRLCTGCQTKIDTIRGLCDVCQAARNKPVVDDGIKTNVAVRHDGAYDAYIDSLNKGTRWQRISKRVLCRDVFCKRCDIAPSELTDHIVPAAVAIQQARDSGHWPLDRSAGYYLMSNLQGLCRACHGIKTGEDKQHIGLWPSVVDKELAAPKKIYSF